MEAQAPEPVVSLTYLGSGWAAVLNRLGYTNLADYRKSGRWKATEAAFQERNPARVCLCGQTEGLQVSHVSLHHIGRELPQDLAWLCSDCRAILKPLLHSGEVNSLGAAKLAVSPPKIRDEPCTGQMDCPCGRCRADIHNRRLRGVRPPQGLPIKPPQERNRK